MGVLKVSRWMKVGIWITAVLLALILAVLLFISPIAKWAVEKYSPKYLGRQVFVEKLRLNLLNGHVRLQDVRILEADPESDFATIRLLDARIDLNDLAKRRFTLRRGTVDHLHATTIHSPEGFNFDDIVQLFSPKKNIKDPKKGPWEYHLADLSIDKASVTYTNTYYGNSITLDSLDITCPLISGSEPDSDFEFDFLVRSGGAIGGRLRMNMQTIDYDLDAGLESLSLDPLLPYAKDFLKLGGLNGKITWAARVSGGPSGFTNVASTEDLYVEDLRLSNATDVPILAFSTLHFLVNEFDMAAKVYDLQAVVLNRPYVHYEIHPDGDNISSLVIQKVPDQDVVRADSVQMVELQGQGFSNLFAYLSGFVKQVTTSYMESNYFADQILLEEGQVQFSDYTLNEKFNFLLTELNVEANKVTGESGRILFIADSRVNERGQFNASWSVDPRNLEDMDLEYRLAQLPVSGFNPYTKQFVAYPFWEGAVYYEGTATIEDFYINSDNRITIKQLEVGEKVESEDAIRLPVKMAVAVLRDLNGDIFIRIPVKGDLNDPKYKLWRVVFKVISNIIVKAAVAPFKLLAAKFGVDEKDLEEVPFNYLQDDMRQGQIKAMNAIAKVLKGKPDLKLGYFQYTDSDTEKEFVAIELAKEIYLAGDGAGRFENDSIGLLELSLNDSLFLDFLSARVPDTLGAIPSPQQRCLHLAGAANVNAEFERLYRFRNEGFYDYLINQLEVDSSQVGRWEPDSLPSDLNTERPRLLLNFSLKEEGTEAGASASEAAAVREEDQPIPAD